MTGAIDLAFVDRADIKQYIGLPSVEATYEIYRSCIQELVKTGLLKFDKTLLPCWQVNAATAFEDALHESSKLFQIAK